MTTAEVFNRHRDIVRQMKKLEMQLDRDTPTGAPRGLSAISYDRLPATNDSLTARMQALDGIEALYIRLAAQLQTLRPVIDAELAGVTSYRLLSILSLYYLQGLTDEAIAESLYMDDRYVCKLRNRYMRQLASSAASGPIRDIPNP